MEKFVLEYYNLPITIQVELSGATYYDPAESDDFEIEVDYDFDLELWELDNALNDIIYNDEKKLNELNINIDNIESEDQIWNYIQKNRDNLFIEYYDKLLNLFKDLAIDDAELYYNSRPNKYKKELI